jgi:hypothetical protein
VRNARVWQRLLGLERTVIELIGVQADETGVRLTNDLAVGVVTDGDQQGGGAVLTDADALQQFGDVGGDDGGELCFQVADFGVQVLDALGQ